MENTAGATGGVAGPVRTRDVERAAFLARMTAGATHEFRNLLAIVQESAGLVGDLLVRAGPGGERDRLLRALARIDEQVARGAGLCTSLNRVAHGLDRAEESLELEVVLEHAVRLSGRGARQRGRRLEWLGSGERARSGSAPAVVARVTANALDLYLGLVAALEWSVERVAEGGVLQVRVEWWEGCPAIRLTAQPELVVAAEVASGEPLLALTRALGGLPVRVEQPVPGPLLLRFE